MPSSRPMLEIGRGREHWVQLSALVFGDVAQLAEHLLLRAAKLSSVVRAVGPVAGEAKWLKRTLLKL